MSYRIKLRREALQELKRLPAYVRAEALQKIDSLEEDPRPPRAKELRGKPGIFRLWLTGRWRLAYGVDDERAEVWILRIRSKGSIDYESLTWEIHEPISEYSARLSAHTTVSDDHTVLLPSALLNQLGMKPGDNLRIIAARGAITLVSMTPGTSK